jgi:hypothetical protein
VVAVRERGREGILTQGPRGSWRNVLTGEELTFSGRQPLARVVDEHGVGAFERVGGGAV